VDTLVFGGNFLHSFGIEKQLKIAQVEDTTKVVWDFFVFLFSHTKTRVLGSSKVSLPVLHRNAMVRFRTLRSLPVGELSFE